MPCWSGWHSPVVIVMRSVDPLSAMLDRSEEGLDASPPNARCDGGRGPVSVFVLAGVRLFEQGLAQVVGARPGLRVQGSASAWRTALDAMVPDPPQVLLMDSGVADGIGAVQAIVGALPDVKVVVVAVRRIEGDVLPWAEAGVAGIVSVEASLDDVVEVIRSVTAGETVCSPWLAGLLLRRVSALARARGPAHHVSCLTARELEIVRLLDRGLSNKEIAAALHVQLPTVKNHVHNILEKLSVRRRGEAAALVRASGY
jgi:two-component system, NarL family, nitrate/nitrite response regulator NarL